MNYEKQLNEEMRKLWEEAYEMGYSRGFNMGRLEGKDEEIKEIKAFFEKIKKK